MTPVSIEPDPYTLALKDLREAKEQIRQLTCLVNALATAGDQLEMNLLYATERGVEVARAEWAKAKENKGDQ